MKAKLKRLCQDTISYGVGGILAKSLSLFLLPVYTKIFDPKMYGIVEMMLIFTGFVGTALTLGMDSAQSFFFFEQKKSGVKCQSTVISSIFQLRIIWAIIVVSLITLCSSYINKLIFHNNISTQFILITCIDAFFIQLLYQAAEINRLQFNPAKFIIITFIHQFFSNFIALFLIIKFNLGVMGYLLGMMLGSLSTCIISWLYMRAYIISWLCASWWPRLLKFGLPLMPSGIALYTMQATDRLCILHLMDEYNLGIYSAGAKFAMMFSMGIEIFRKAWWPLAMDAIHDKKGDNFIKIAADFYMSIATVAAILMAFISPLLVNLFLSSEYHDSVKIIGILVWQGVFWGFYLIGSIGAWKSESTLTLTVILVFYMGLNIFFNFMFIPHFGIIGAAYGNVLTYLLWNLTTIFFAESKWRIGYNIASLFLKAVSGFAISNIYLNVYTGHMSKCIGVFYLFLPSVVLFTFLSKEVIMLVKIMTVYQKS